MPFDFVYMVMYGIIPKLIYGINMVFLLQLPTTKT